MMPPTSTTKPSSNQGLGKDNIGSKMLKAMGWSEGQGLGRSNQGTSTIIEVERRVTGAGLGAGTTTLPAGNLSYKDAVRQAMARRFEELDKR